MTRRIPSLDGLRAISITLVILGHLVGTRNFPVELSFLKPYANLGVRVFFIISGYLITKLLLEERDQTGKLDLLEFYRRRAYRIFPAAYLYMLVMAALHWRSLTGRQLLVTFTYLSSYYHSHNSWMFGHLWSLSVEEQFYLIWPFALAMGFVMRKRMLILTIALCPLLRVAFHFLHLPDRHIYFPTVLDTIATGCLLAIFWEKLRRHDRFLLSRAAWILPAVACGVPLLQNIFYGYKAQAAYEVFGLTIMHFAIAGTIYIAVRKKWHWLNVQPVIWVGVVSYSLYLWQQAFLEDRTSASWWTAFPINMILALLCAAASYYCVERTFLQLRNRDVVPLQRPFAAATVEKEKLLTTL